MFCLVHGRPSYQCSHELSGTHSGTTLNTSWHNSWFLEEQRAYGIWYITKIDQVMINHWLNFNMSLKKFSSWVICWALSQTNRQMVVLIDTLLPWQRKLLSLDRVNMMWCDTNVRVMMCTFVCLVNTISIILLVVWARRQISVFHSCQEDFSSPRAPGPCWLFQIRPLIFCTVHLNTSSKKPNHSPDRLTWYKKKKAFF